MLTNVKVLSNENGKRLQCLGLDDFTPLFNIKYPINQLVMSQYIISLSFVF